MIKRIAASAVALVLGVSLAAAPATAGSGQPPKPYKNPVQLVGVQAYKAAPPVGRQVSSARLLSTAVRHYAGGYQFATHKGLSANLNVFDPYRNPAEDNHTIVELAAQDDVNGHIVEVGWGKGTFCSTSAVCLWVYHWVNGVGQGYNTGFVDYAPNPRNVGDVLATATGFDARFQIQESAGNWWISLNEGLGAGAQWVGYFPQSRWTSQGASYTTGNLVQAFGEVVSQDSGTSGQNGYPCSDMGRNGELGQAGNANAARIGTTSIQGLATTAVNLTAFTDATAGYGNPSPGRYEAAVASGSTPGNARTIRYGGPGYAATGTGVGTAGSC